MCKRKIYTICIIFLWLLLHDTALFAKITKVTDVKYYQDIDGIRIIISASSEPVFKRSKIIDPRIISYDFMSTRYFKPIDVINIMDSGIKRIIISQYSPNKMRIAILCRKRLKHKIYRVIKGSGLPCKLIIFIERRVNLNVKKPVVVIDPGHGGKDPGAVSPHGLKEKDVTFSIARYLYRILKKDAGIVPYLTRYKDRYVGLKERIDYAEKRNASAFISIHADACPKKEAKGTSVFYLSLTGASDALSSALAERENAADKLYGPVRVKNKKLARILLDLRQNYNLKESAALASIVHSALKKRLNTVSRGVKRAGFAVLKTVTVPSILIEVAFLSNPYEEKLLRDYRFRKKVALAIYEGIRKFVSLYYEPYQILAKKLKKALKNKSTRQWSKMVKYKVKRGETLGHIARKFKTRISLIRIINKIYDINKIRAGQILLVPGGR